MSAMFRAACALLVPVVLFGVGACASKPTPVSAPQSAARQWNERGRAAFERGDYQAALADYQEALSASRAIENADDIADELMNLAVVYGRLGDSAQAQRRLDEILAAERAPFSRAQRAEAAYRKAVLAFDGGRTDAAAALLDRALEFCRGERCAVEGRVYNLRARMALAGGDAAAATAHARRALAANRGADDTAEQANSLRLMADAALKNGDPATAGVLYDQALDADKANGDGAKIALDLLGLGQCAERRQDRAAAREFFRRAYAVSEAAGSRAGMESASRALQSSPP